MLIVPYIPGEPQTRSKNLQRSAVRSWSAKVAHQKRKQTQRQRTARLERTKFPHATGCGNSVLPNRVTDPLSDNELVQRQCQTVSSMIVPPPSSHSSADSKYLLVAASRGTNEGPNGEDEARTWLKSNFPARHPYLTRGVLSPFNAMVTKIDRPKHDLLQYLINIAIPEKWISSTRFNSNNLRVRNVVLDLFPRCFTSDVLLYGILAGMSSRTQRLEGWRHLPPTEFYAQSAYELLRQHLDNSDERISPEVLYSMLFLALGEWHLGHLPISMMHFRAMARLIDDCGGLHMLQNWKLMETIIQGDVGIAAEQLTRPIFPLTWDPGRLGACRWNQIQSNTALPKLGVSLMGILTSGDIFPEALATIVEDIVQCVQVAASIWRRKQALEGDLEWIFRRYLAIHHRLLTLDSTNWHAETLRITLILWVLVVMTSLERRKSVKFLLPRLQRALLAANAEKPAWSGNNRPLLLWILTTASLEIVRPGGEATQEEWFLNFLSATSFELHVCAEHDYREMLYPFLYLESVQSASMGPLFKKLGDWRCNNLGHGHVGAPVNARETHLFIGQRS